MFACWLSFYHTRFIFLASLLVVLAPSSFLGIFPSISSLSFSFAQCILFLFPSLFVSSSRLSSPSSGHSCHNTGGLSPLLIPGDTIQACLWPSLWLCCEVFDLASLCSAETGLINLKTPLPPSGLPLLSTITCSRSAFSSLSLSSLAMHANVNANIISPTLSHCISTNGSRCFHMKQ